MQESDIKIGKYIRINSYPNEWSSMLVDNCPSRISTYPVLGRIIELKNPEDSNYLNIGLKILVFEPSDNYIVGQNFGYSAPSFCRVSEELQPIGDYIKINRHIKPGLTIGNTYKITGFDVTFDNDAYFVVQDDNLHLCRILFRRLQNNEIKYIFKEFIDIPKPIDGSIDEPIIVSNNEVLLYKDERIKLPIRKKIVKPLTDIQEQAVRLLLTKPEDYRKFLSKVENPKYIANYINQLLPTRVGYEFDTAGYSNFPDRTKNKLTKITKQLKLNRGFFEYHVDDIDTSYISTTNREIRISFKTITGYKYLKQLLHEFVEAGIKPGINGGLHIHIDVGSKLNEARKNDDLLWKYRNYIYNVFDIPKGDSIRNERKYLSKGYERAKICIGRCHNTVEWRLSDTTFDYTQILKWTIFCHLMTEMIKHRNEKLNMNLYENIRYVA